MMLSNEAARSRAGTPDAGCRRSRESRSVSGSDAPQVAQLQPLAGEVRRPARCDRGSASMRRTCVRAPPGSCSWPCAATSSSSSSGMLLQRKNDRREASSRSLMRRSRRRGYSADRARREDELRAGQNAAKRRSMPVSKPLRARPASIEASAARRQLGCRDRPAIGAPRQRRDESSSRTALLPTRCAGRQVKMRRRLGVSPVPVALERPGDRHALDVRQARVIGRHRACVRRKGCSRSSRPGRCPLEERRHHDRAVRP